MHAPRSKLTRILLGVGTFLPLPAIAAIIVAFVFDPSGDAWLSDTTWARDWFWLAWSLGFGAFAVGALLAIYYMAIVMGSDATQSERNFWLMTLWSFYPIVGPIFWYRVIWRRQSVSEATVRA